METHAQQDLERVHLDIVSRRMYGMKKGEVKRIDGHEASLIARKLINN